MILGIVPARGGSKSIPRKNIAPLGGRPLLAYTAAAALASRSLDRVVLSTDDAEIAQVGRALGLAVPFLRPAEIAADDTPMLAVIAHLLDWVAGAVEAVVLLQPTSPFRTASHIDEAVALFRERDADTVVSVLPVPHQFTPSSLMRLDDGILSPYLASGPQPTLRQQKEPLYARNGPAVLVIRPQTIRAGRLYGARTIGYEMDRAASLDIDGPEDLALAELLLAAQRGRHAT